MGSYSPHSTAEMAAPPTRLGLGGPAKHSHGARASSARGRGEVGRRCVCALIPQAPGALTAVCLGSEALNAEPEAGVHTDMVHWGGVGGLLFRNP